MHLARSLSLHVLCFWLALRFCLFPGVGSLSKSVFVLSFWLARNSCLFSKRGSLFVYACSLYLARSSFLLVLAEWLAFTLCLLRCLGSLFPNIRSRRRAIVLVPAMLQHPRTRRFTAALAPITYLPVV